MECLQQLDGEILLWLQEYLRCPPLSAFLVPLTVLGEAGTIWILISILLLLRPKTRKAGWMALLAMLVCYLMNDQVFKKLVDRPRPFLALPDLTPLITRPASFSFPSGHSCSSFAAATTYWRGLRGKGLDWFRYLMVVLAFLMAFSRLYVGVHYPTDVLVGGLVGVLGATLLWLGLNRRYDRVESALLKRK